MKFLRNIFLKFDLLVLLAFINAFCFLFLYNLLNNGSVIYNDILIIIYWIFFFGFLICSVMAINLTKLQNKYSKGGCIYNWYDTTLKLKGTLWLKNTFDQLQKKELINNDDKLVIISPSANKGTYEKELFNHMCQKNMHSKFIVTDLNLIDDYEQSFNNDYGEFIYLHEKNDAREVKQILNKVGESKADIIIDIEGCLWHFKEDNWFHKKKCIKLITDAFEKYYEVLQENGLIIIDNRAIPKYEVFLRYFSAFILHFKFGNGHYCTGHYLTKLYEKNKIFKGYIDSNFKVYKIDALNEYGKIISSIIYKKATKN